MENDKSLMVFKYEKELDEFHNFFAQEQQKLKKYYEERLASVEKQNQNLKSQIDVLSSLGDSRKNGCEIQGKELHDLKRLHEEELQEVERNLALTLSQQLHSLTNLSEQEKLAITKEKDAEIQRLNDNCRDLNEVITSLEEQAGNYPDLLEKFKESEEKLSKVRVRCDKLRKEVELQQQQERQQLQQTLPQHCQHCEQLRTLIRGLEQELVALRKLEEDNILLASENEKLIEQLEVEKQKLNFLTCTDMPDESKLKLEELSNEKSPAKINSKKYLKKRVSQLENDCKDLWRKLQSEVLKGRQQELEISRKASEKERILQALRKAQIGSSIQKNNQNKSSNVSLNNSNAEEKRMPVGEDKDNDYFMLKDKLKKAQNRSQLLQVKAKFQRDLLFWFRMPTVCISLTMKAIFTMMVFLSIGNNFSSLLSKPSINYRKCKCLLVSSDQFHGSLN